jgi:hypothetical protein
MNYSPMIKTCLCLLALLALVTGKKDEWYQQCESGDCGHSASRGSSDCHDLSEECRAFFLKGECIANAGWMSENCRKSCGICLPADDDGEPCKDLHTNCRSWAGEYQCFTNPSYMSHACPSSCWMCANRTELEGKGVSEENIQRYVRFSQTDFGFWQVIPTENDAPVRMELQKMEKYMRMLKKTGPGTVCNNVHHHCAAWVIEKGCHANLEFMLPQCSLACQFCDIIEDYHRCRGTEESSSKVPFGNLNNIFTHLHHDMEAENLLEGYSEDPEEGEWVLSMDKSALWNKNAEDESQKLLAILQSENSILEWKNASAENYTDSPTDIAPDRSGRSASCSTQCQRSEPVLSSLTQAIASLLQIKPSHLQSLEFVHHKRGDRFAAHHDFRLHDQWKHSGNHVLTVFIALQNPQDGGAFGFPELDWLRVEKPQVLVWPNIVSKRPNKALKRMHSELLPVVEGEMYGVYAWVRQYPFDESNPCA